MSHPEREAFSRFVRIACMKLQNVRHERPVELIIQIVKDSNTTKKTFLTADVAVKSSVGLSEVVLMARLSKWLQNQIH